MCKILNLKLMDMIFILFFKTVGVKKEQQFYIYICEYNLNILRNENWNNLNFLLEVRGDATTDMQ